ncbi:hypothetical protein [Leclercia sp. UBA5958]|uniref:hypothetical protein n=1 Tax=Leclercia sp. UBA5958 TaxID=1946742 RepID=UPI00257E77AE|nr:hypothetical protein [Leclercia sp. UBA5958]
MSLTYKIREVTVTLPSLGTITTDGPGNQIKHGDKCRVGLYAVEPEWRSGSIFEGFIVGWLTFEGYCETPYKRSQKIMMPYGYDLVALKVDEWGMPTSWDSLPVQFSGGSIGTPVDALIGNGVGSGWRITNGIASHNFIPKKDISDHCQQGESRVKILAEKFSVAANTQNALEAALQEVIKKVVDESLQQAMQPGGTIWNSLRRGF